MKKSKYSDTQIMSILKQTGRSDECQEDLELRPLLPASAERERVQVEPQAGLPHLLRAGTEHTVHPRVGGEHFQSRLELRPRPVGNLCR